MPPRFFVFAVVAFWLATTSWLVYREILPRLQVGEPPPFTIDLTDEVGANSITWHIVQKSGPAGEGTSWVTRQPDRTFEFGAKFNLEKTDSFPLNLVHVVSTTYRVTPDGQLLGLTATVKSKEFPVVGKVEGTITGVVEDGMLTSEVVSNIDKPFKLAPVRLSHTGSILNPMHLVNKISGLQVGQSWQIPLLDPLPAGLPGQELVIPSLLARVSEEDLPWPSDELVPCYRIDYSKPGNEVVASTWVRQRDGLVLRQQAQVHGIDLAFVRKK